MASPLEQFVNNVRTMSASVLETLDVQQHSLGVMAVLVAKFSLPPGTGDADRSTMFQQIQDFLNNCNGEQPIRGIETLKKAIRKIQLFDSQLTSIHADLCQLCLLSKCMKPAIDFLETDVTGIGMIYTAMKNYDRALYFFEVVVTVPSMVVSHIMLEAYKKYILVSFILHGKVVCRFLKPLSVAYHELGSSQHAAIKHRETFIRDKNMGLVNQVLSSMYKKNIQRLTKTFLTLSLTDVASRIEEGEIYAMINQKDGMVVFLDSPEKYLSPETLCVLEQQMAACTKLHQYIQEMDEQIQVNPQVCEVIVAGDAVRAGAADGGLHQAAPVHTGDGRADTSEPSGL
ncbi:COP9 complex subunit 3-like protein [Operophtera brumata]|uniref:COP9 signalosome complex subunit 3 n=1 Tax=Operophtera brumata TaxID=104452 RepID=A0A0L7KT67_OPEBR|nr:COP9 complex subunit 3-like protein [Operophtera brumata]